MAAVLVTLAQAHGHLRLTFTLNTSPVDARQTDLELKLDQAEEAILTYCKTTSYWREIVPGWTGSPITAPKEVIAAILLMLTHLWEHRGDDMKTDEDLWLAIGRLLARTRDPVLA